MASTRVFTIPASAPFLPTLISALVGGKLVQGFPAAGDPLALASATLYLPTKRACLLARDIFLDVTKAQAAILPRIVALGDIDEDEIAFAEAATGALAEEALELAPSLDGLERRLLLAQLILKWAAAIHPDRGAPLVANNPGTALALADDLAHLLDDITTRQVSWDKLDGLVPDALDQYWQQTLRFLQIARETWPAILSERNAIEPAARRDALIEAESKQLKTAQAGPVIAAGSTGSMPATATLLATIAKLPQGAVVLPGLDCELDDASWDLIAGKPDGAGGEIIAPGHPQFALAALLRRIGIPRAAVTPLADPAPQGRESLASEALRPAPSTELWQARLSDETIGPRVAAGLSNLTVIEAANAEDEALAIAVALREAAETPKKTAALITPDRALARRVLAALDRWKVEADDSGGDPLADTPAGVFARLATQAALSGLEPVPLLALLKHPLLRLDAPAGGHRDAIAALERAVLRGPRPRAGSAALAHALGATRLEWNKLKAGESSEIHRSDPRADLTAADFDAAASLIEKLAAALAPVESLPRNKAPLALIAARHREIVASLSKDEAGRIAAFAGQDGAALAAIIDEIAASEAAQTLAVTPAEYPDVFHAAIGGRIVRRPVAPDARIRILGPLEARLQHLDLAVLGGLIEGIWPPEPRSDPWLSRPMRKELGLDLPELRIGLSAHDFTQALAAPEVVLTRAAKREGAPTVSSRFLQRLAAVAGESWQDAVKRGDVYLGYARALDRPADVKPVGRPQPRPPVAARPRQLSVTEIEHWLRDPYTIYAKHILRLTRLDPVDMPPGGAARGSFIHEAIGDFTKAFGQQLPDDVLDRLIAFGRARFAPLEDYPEARALWWPRFERIARWFVAWEHERRPALKATHAEISGKIDVSPNFKLTARADRIERRADDSYAILDYKTGIVPSDKQVRIGVAPQLTLEAAIARGGGFAAISKGASIAEIVYVKLKGGVPGGESKPVDLKDRTADAAADYALARLKDLAARFADERQPYRSIVLPMWKNRYGCYDDLARVKEWSDSGAEGDGGGDE